MRRYLLDTGIAQDFLNSRRGIHSHAIDVRRRGDRVGICTPVLGELWSGIECSQSRDRNEQRLLHGLSQLIVWPYTLEAAAEFGRIFSELRRIGRPMQQIDIQIAAIARSLGNCTVVSRDSDLHAIPNLKVEDWAA